LLQPRLPRYKRGDISLNLALAYQYSKEGYGIIQEYFRSPLHKIPGFIRYPQEDIRDGYIVNLELQIRNNKIIEGRMIKFNFNNRTNPYKLNGEILNGKINQDISTYNY